MPRTISIAEARGNLESLIDWVEEHQDVIIIEVDGTPDVVLMSYRQYEAFAARREGRL